MPRNQQPNNTAIHPSVLLVNNKPPPKTKLTIHKMCNFTPHRFTNWVSRPLPPNHPEQTTNNYPSMSLLISSARFKSTQLTHH